MRKGRRPPNACGRSRGRMTASGLPRRICGCGDPAICSACGSTAFPDWNMRIFPPVPRCSKRPRGRRRPCCGRTRLWMRRSTFLFRRRLPVSSGGSERGLIRTGAKRGTDSCGNPTPFAARVKATDLPCGLNAVTGVRPLRGAGQSGAMLPSSRTGRSPRKPFRREASSTVRQK